LESFRDLKDIMDLKYIHTIEECRDVALVGGKGANLGKLVRAGFEVPGGFVVDTRGFKRAQEAMGGAAEGLRVPKEIPQEVVAEILAAYKGMGGGAVAVRSSATAEDMAAASMAGQYETFLDVEGEAQLLEKVRHCWASLDSPRIRAYLSEHGIDQSTVAMGVVVQKLVPSEVAGVLFTINPNGGRNAKKEMLIEASWGLGESVVGGRVQPDVLRVEAETGRVIEAVIADKRVVLAAGAHEERAVEESRRKEACLKEGDVKGLWELGRKAAGHFGVPQDIEWGIYQGKVYLLQSRPITTHLEAEMEGEVLEGIKGWVRAALKGGGQAGWLRYGGRQGGWLWYGRQAGCLRYGGGGQGGCLRYGALGFA
jgi:pyruvate,water dikinase